MAQDDARNAGVTRYNQFAGQNLERLNGLSDGIVAVAMTLLILDVRLPEGGAEGGGLGDALFELRPELLAYLLSFTMLGTFWLAQHTLLELCDRADRTAAWLHLAFLLSVTFQPFTTTVLSEYLDDRLAVVLYWANLLLLGSWLAAGALHGRRAGLVPAGEPRARLRVFTSRIVLAQLLYGIAALLCLIDTVVSVVALLLVQAYFVVSPRLPWFGQVSNRVSRRP